MPINTRYTKGPYSTTSSLYRSAQSAQNKVNQVQDAEMKFMWDSGQLSNEEYLAYVQKRGQDAAAAQDVMDKISWSRAEMSVGKEIRSDKRAQLMLQLSAIPENTSAKIRQKIDGLIDLYNDAAQWGDEDAMVSLETQINNATNSYYSKVEGEAKSSNAKAFTQFKDMADSQLKMMSAVEAALGQNKLLTNPEEFLTGRAAPIYEEITDPLEKYIYLEGINTSRAQIAQAMFEATSASKPDDVSAAMAYQANAQKAMFQAEKFGSVIKRNPDGSPVVQTDAYGMTRIEPADDKIVAYDASGKVKIVDKKTNEELVEQQDENGNTILVGAEGRDGYYTDPTSGRQYQITDRKMSGDNQYKMSKESDSDYKDQVDAGEALDTRTFMQPLNQTPLKAEEIMEATGSTERPKGIEWNLNSGNPTTANPVLAELLQQQMIKYRTNKMTYDANGNPVMTPMEGASYNPYNNQYLNSGPVSQPGTEGTVRDVGPQNVDLRTPTGFATFTGLDPRTGAKYISKSTPGQTSLLGAASSVVQRQAGGIASAVSKVAKPAATAASFVSPATAAGSLVGKAIKKVIPKFTPTPVPAGSNYGPLMIRPTGGQLIGQKGGINYFRVPKAGGWDFYKGKDFKISVNDVAKEVLGNSSAIGNYLNKNWHL